VAVIAAGAPAQQRIACLGDSITFGARIADRLHSSYPSWLNDYLGESFEVRNFGVGGATMLRSADNPYHASDAFRDALEWRPDLAVVILGTNDTCENQRRQNWRHADSLADDAQQLVASLHGTNPDMRVLLCSPTGMFANKAGLSPARKADLLARAPRLAECAAAARRVAEQTEHVEYLELTNTLREQDVGDGVHPTAFGAERLARRIAEAIRHPLAPATPQRERLVQVLSDTGSQAQPDSFRGFHGVKFQLPQTNAACRIYSPHGTARGAPWILRARFFGHQPALDIALLERGFHLAYCDVSNLYGAPEAVDRYSELHTLLTAGGFARRAVLEGMSRGGLPIIHWAIAHPQHVASLYGDNPVVDIRSWPGGNSGKRSTPDWRRCLEAYGLDEAKAASKQPVSTKLLRPLAAADVPLLLVLGLADEVVPAAENGLLLAERYAAAGGEVEVWQKPGVGHHPHGLHPVDPLLRAILRASGFGQNVSTTPAPSVEFRSGAGWHGDSWRTQVTKMRALARANDKTPIVFLGDSITQGLTGARDRLTKAGGGRAIDRAFGEHGAISLGLSGDRTEHLLYRIQHGALQDLDPAVIVLQIGVNNIVTGGHTADEVLRGVQAIVTSLRRFEPQATVLVCGPFPAGAPDSQAREATTRIQAAHDLLTRTDGPSGGPSRPDKVIYQNLHGLFLDEDGGFTNNMRKDGIHINARGQEAWMSAIKPTVDALLR